MFKLLDLDSRSPAKVGFSVLGFRVDGLGNARTSKFPLVGMRLKSCQDSYCFLSE